MGSDWIMTAGSFGTGVTVLIIVAVSVAKCCGKVEVTEAGGGGVPGKPPRKKDRRYEKQRVLNEVTNVLSEAKRRIREARDNCQSDISETVTQMTQDYKIRMDTMDAGVEDVSRSEPSEDAAKMALRETLESKRRGLLDSLEAERESKRQEIKDKIRQVMRTKEIEFREQLDQERREKKYFRAEAAKKRRDDAKEEFKRWIKLDQKSSIEGANEELWGMAGESGRLFSYKMNEWNRRIVASVRGRNEENTRLYDETIERLKAAIDEKVTGYQNEVDRIILSETVSIENVSSSCVEQYGKVVKEKAVALLPLNMNALLSEPLDALLSEPLDSATKDLWNGLNTYEDKVRCYFVNWVRCYFVDKDGQSGVDTLRLSDVIKERVDNFERGELIRRGDLDIPVALTLNIDFADQVDPIPDQESERTIWEKDLLDFLTKEINRCQANEDERLANERKEDYQSLKDEEDDYKGQLAELERRRKELLSSESVQTGAIKLVKTRYDVVDTYRKAVLNERDSQSRIGRERLSLKE